MLVYFICGRKDLLSVDDIEQINGKKRRSNKEERIASAKVEITFILITYLIY